MSPSSIAVPNPVSEYRTATTDRAASSDPVIASVLSSTVAAGACPSAIFLPRAPASPAEISASDATQEIAPLYYAVTPAPMGLTDYGLAAGTAGTLHASVLNTPRLWGQFDLNETGIQPLDLYNNAPDSYGIQLNAVLTNVTLLGTPGYEFWTQNVFEFYPSLHYMAFITNVWNFSGGYALGSAIYQHGANGTVYSNEVYEAEVTFSNISYPFNLSLYLNSTLIDGRDAVFFTGVLVGASEAVNVQFDDVVFNSIEAGGSSLSAPAEFSANGTGYDPAGETNDFELIVGGPGGGSEASLYAADALLGLAYWNSSADQGSGGFVSVPSAFSFGGETGETASGATVTWSNESGGPSGFSTYARMTTGPAILTGLWNATGPEGSYPVTIQSTPGNAFEIVTPVANDTWQDLSPFISQAPSQRSGAQEAYSPALHRTILFGGYGVLTDTALADTYDFAAGQWSLATPFGPPARWGGAFVYDAADGYLLLFGGQSTSNRSGFLSDTWTYTGSGWLQHHPSSAPSPRSFAAITYDAADSEVVLFGGGIGSSNGSWTVFNDTWTYRAGVWTNITATVGTPPPATMESGMAYDASDGYVLMVGGASTGSTSIPCAYPDFSEWRFVGGQWSVIPSNGPSPPPGIGSLWFDTEAGTTYYYEGVENLTGSTGCRSFTGDLWSYSGGSWQMVRPGGVPGSPSPRIEATVVDDELDHLQLLFGGEPAFGPRYFGDTWAITLRARSPGSTIPLLASVPAIGPTVTTDTFWLPAGNYSVLTELSGYAPVTTAVDVAGPALLRSALSSDPTLGVYTPLWAWSNAQMAALAVSGSGTSSDPYVLENNQPRVLDPIFMQINDWGYPSYAGVFFLDTSVPTELKAPPTFMAAWPVDNAQESQLPLWFWNVSHLAFVDGTDVGQDTVAVTLMCVIFYDSSDNLIAQNLFTPTTFALTMESGPQSGPFTGPGGNNTIWGNTFSTSSYNPSNLLEILELESNDLIYNNRFLFPVPGACQPGDPSLTNWCWYPYSLVPKSFSNTWNITVQPASVTHYAPGFPYLPLSGSIAGTTWQGGNEWWEYGTWPNSYGVLPYEERFSWGDSVASQAPTIDPGGDYAPLHTLPLYTVTFATVGLPPNAWWSGSVSNRSGFYDLFFTNATQFAVELPNGTTTYAIPSPGYGLLALNGTIVVAGSNCWIQVAFLNRSFSVNFTESGLAAKTLFKQGWTVVLNGVSVHGWTSEITFGGLPTQEYPVLVTGPPGYRTDASGLVNVSGATNVSVLFRPGPTVTLTFAEKGLAGSAGQPWCVQLDGARSCATAKVQRYPNLSPGTYSYSVLSPLAGQVITGQVGPTRLNLTNGTTATVTVRAAARVALTFAYRYTVTFSQASPFGLTSGDWNVTLGKLTKRAPYNSPITFNETNGTYAYRVISPGYRSSGTPAKVVVAGAKVSVKVTFAKKANRAGSPVPELFGSGPPIPVGARALLRARSE